MPTGRRQTSWLCTSVTEELSQDYVEQIQLVVRAGPHKYIQVQTLLHLALLLHFDPW